MSDAAAFVPDQTKEDQCSRMSFASAERSAAEKRDWLVVSMVSDASFGPFTEDEAEQFAGWNENYAAFRTRDLQRQMESALKYGLVFAP